MIDCIVAEEEMRKWLVEQIERSRQLTTENPISTRKVLERVLAKFSSLFDGEVIK